MPLDPTSLLTPAQVARLYNVDPKTVTRWAKAGRVHFIRTPAGHRRYPAGQFAAVIAARQREVDRARTAVPPA